MHKLNLLKKHLIKTIIQKNLMFSEIRKIIQKILQLVVAMGRFRDTCFQFKFSFKLKNKLTSLGPWTVLPPSGHFNYCSLISRYGWHSKPALWLLLYQGSQWVSSIVTAAVPVHRLNRWNINLSFLKNLDTACQMTGLNISHIALLGILMKW